MASLFQVAGMVFVYRRLIFVIGVFPAVAALSPALFWFAATVLRLAAGNHGALCLGLTVASTALLRHQIYRVAPSKAALEFSLQKNQVKLPALMFLASCIVARRVGELPPVRLLGRVLQSTMSSILPGPWTFLRVAAAALVAGIFVASRYAGLTGYMRCSPFPLVPYRLDAKLRAFWKHPFAFLQQQASPITQLQKMKQQTSDMGRRHQRPSVLFYFQHAVLSVLTGFIVYYAVKFPTMFQNNDLLACDALFIACILTLGSTLYSLIDGVSHELDPYKYLYPSDTMRPKTTTTTSFVPWPFVLIPLVSITSASLLVGGGVSALGDVVLFSKLSIGCALMTAYIYTIDHQIRMALFNPPADLHRLLQELANDDTTSLTRLGVMLSSILCDASLVKQVWSGPAGQNSIGGPESEEIILCETLYETMANILLRPIDPSTEAPLDEDVLRIAILESLGGKLATDSSSSSGNESTERHEKEINKWIGLPTPLRASGSRVEHLSIPLVRGLCVFIGGFGTALTIICSSSATDSVRGTTAQPKPARCTWTLPPAVFVCLDFAVTAVGRCIVRSLSPSGRTLSDWTSAVLSNQIPVALKALHRLREGIAEYSIRTTNDEKADLRAQVANQIGSNLSSPDHWKIVRACDAAATRILESAKSPSGHGRINLLLDPACLEWKHELMARNVPSQ